MPGARFGRDARPQQSEGARFDRVLRLILNDPLRIQAVPSPDYIVPVEIESYWHNFYVLKRPGVDEFLRRMGEIYEVVVFTASLSKVIFNAHSRFPRKFNTHTSSVCGSSIG